MGVTVGFASILLLQKQLLYLEIKRRDLLEEY